MRGGTTTRTRHYWIELSDLHWPGLFVLFSVLGLISAGTVYTADLAEGASRSYIHHFVREMSGYYAAYALLPLVVLGFARFPIRRSNWHWVVPLHVLFSMGMGLTLTYVMLFSRRILYGFLDLGVYDYGHMGYRLLMEYHKQCLFYWLVYAVLRAVAYYRESRDRERATASLELKASELQRELTQAQLQTLRSQLNPHFLFNTLNMVSSVMYEDVDRADHMLSALSRMLRMSLEEGTSALTPLRRELEFVEAASELLRARFQDRIEIMIDCPHALLNCRVPHMLLYTLVENAVKHHQADPDPVIRVRVEAQCSEKRLHLRVSDNGPGIADPKEAIGKGVGLANTLQRLRALYGEACEFGLRNRLEGGLEVHVGLPLESKDPPSARRP